MVEMQMEWSYVFAVVIVGLLVVFFGLVILIACISIIGKIITAIEKKKTEKPVDVNTSETAISAQQTVSNVNVSDEDEIIAAISAAVAMMSEADNTSYRIKSVRPINCGSSLNIWKTAGLMELTKPF